MTGRRGRKSGPLALPEAALLGQLREARELIAKKDFQAAWKSVLGALAVRPFHCEGYLLLAEIAKEAGDTEQARRCAERARQCAPDWKPAKQFLKGLAGTPYARAFLTQLAPNAGLLAAAEAYGLTHDEIASALAGESEPHSPLHEVATAT